jgi:AmmeMemoRadiSam system protein A
MNKGEVLLSIARAVIAKELGIDYDLDIKKLISDNSRLLEKGAVFVTLNTKSNHNLRGCIGSIIAHRSLIDDLIHNAKSAAFNDPRFHPLSKEEFDNIVIDISLLTPPQEVTYSNVEDLKQKIHPNIDGVIIKDSTHQATFLPQVWKELPTFELFMAHLCQKAGIFGECFNHHPSIYTYQVQEYSE